MFLCDEELSYYMDRICRLHFSGLIEMYDRVKIHAIDIPSIG